MFLRRRSLLVLAVLIGLGAGASQAGAVPGSVTLFPLPAGSNGGVGITAGADGNLWFTEAFPAFELATSIGVMTPGGVFSATYPTGTHSDAPGITSGLDGNLWFAEQLSGSIARITQTGVVTHFPLADSRAQPIGIAAGPDGNLWFTERSGEKIGRITPAGAMTEFGSLSSQPSGITAGADGNLWFIQSSPTAIVSRITLDGTITGFPLASAGSNPDGIAAGPDGNLWVAERRANKIARVTPAGQITEFPLPRAGSGPASIVTGSDASLWFTEQPPTTAVAPMLGRITTGGQVTEYPQPSGFPGAITAGPDGNLWLPIDQGQGQVQDIARVSVARARVGYVLSLDAGFVPASRGVGLGGTVQWSFYGPQVHEVADSSGLGLYDSGPQPIVSFYSTSFDAAGVFPYGDPLNAGLAGKVSVPLLASPASGSVATSFTINWASAPPAAGRVFDVQVKRPGATGYSNWMPATTATSAGFLPDAGPGTYMFHSRLRDATTGAKSAYSAGKTISVN